MSEMKLDNSLPLKVGLKCCRTSVESGARAGSVLFCSEASCGLKTLPQLLWLGV
jgi:hypothetical protein